jgi:hypothetical protein
MKIRKKDEIFEISVKRFYLPVDIISNCPECKEETLWDNYLSYPELNERHEIGFWCRTCEYEWSEFVGLTLKVKELK